MSLWSWSPYYHKLYHRVYLITIEAPKYPLITCLNVFSSVFWGSNQELSRLFFFKTCFLSPPLLFFKPTKSGIRDFYILLTAGLLAQKTQLFGLSGLGFLPIAITLDACRWSVGCRNPNPCVGMALCLLAGWAEFHSRVLVVSKHEFCMPSFSWRRSWCDKHYRNSC